MIGGCYLSLLQLSSLAIKSLNSPMALILVYKQLLSSMRKVKTSSASSTCLLASTPQTSYSILYEDRIKDRIFKASCSFSSFDDEFSIRRKISSRYSLTNFSLHSLIMYWLRRGPRRVMAISMFMSVETVFSAVFPFCISSTLLLCINVRYLYTNFIKNLQKLYGILLLEFNQVHKSLDSIVFYEFICKIYYILVIGLLANVRLFWIAHVFQIHISKIVFIIFLIFLKYIFKIDFLFIKII